MPLSQQKAPIITLLRLRVGLYFTILVPRAYDPFGLWLAGPDFLSMRRVFVSHCQPFSFPEDALLFGQHQESRPLAKSNTGSPRFTEFLSLCACSESSLTNLIGSGLNLLCLQSHSKGLSQRSRFLVLTKRSEASGDKNDCQPIRFARFDGKSVNCGLPVLDQTTGQKDRRLWGRE